jgi:hypothetical protein
MPFSMTTYLVGVGTVVGALALGFGSGIFLTNTAIKVAPAGPTRIERVARPEPIAAPPQMAGAQVFEAKAIHLPPADPAPAVNPAVEPAPAIQPQPPVAEVPPAIQPRPPVAEVPKETPHATEVEQPKQVESTKQTEAEQRRATERKIDRRNRYAERKARQVATTRMKQRQWEEQGDPARPELAYDRDEEPRFNPYRRLNAPLYVAPVDPRD